MCETGDCGWHFTPGVATDADEAPSGQGQGQGGVGSNLSPRGLLVAGNWMSVLRCPVTRSRSQGDEEEGEEVFEAEGSIEDMIAIDRDSVAADEDAAPSRHHGNRQSQQQRHFMPPITPQLCIKDNIQMALFDYLWSEVSQQ